MEDTTRSARLHHGQELKRTVLDECDAGGSVASVAMAHGLNANLVHKWRRLQQCNVVAAVAPPIPAQTFIPLGIALSTVTPPTCAEPRELRIELRCGAIVATINWPMSAGAECAGWLREFFDDPHRRTVARCPTGGHARRRRATARMRGAGLRLRPITPRLPIRQRAVHTNQAAGA